jgi:hypothetical protein
MDDHAVSPGISDPEALQQLSIRIRAGDPPERVELDQALEGGFGRLIGLEAELQRTRDRVSTSDGDAERVIDVEQEIAVLRDALTELRTLSSPPGPPRVGYGFVLPKTGGFSSISTARGVSGLPRRL